MGGKYVLAIDIYVIDKKHSMLILLVNTFIFFYAPKFILK